MWLFSDGSIHQQYTFRLPIEIKPLQEQALQSIVTPGTYLGFLFELLFYNTSQAGLDI
jgi:hypothetical protein